MHNIFQDVRFALRQLRKSPSFTLTAVLTLARGIGANAAFFALFDQVQLRMLPVERPQRLATFTLAAAGLCGVLACSIEQRTREIGVRIALGERRWSVVRLSVLEMALITVIAIAAALPGVVAIARLYRNQLYGVHPFDPLALAAAVALTAVVLALAAAMPAHRAASIEPMLALRAE